jgi:hypothetical protein
VISAPWPPDSGNRNHRPLFSTGAEAQNLGLREPAGKLNMSKHARAKRPPYVEVILTIAVMAFLALIIAGGFNQPADEVARATMGAE